jgi:hypothetical protein
MIRCPYCRVDFRNAPYIERLAVEDELSRGDMMIVYCPYPNCNVFLGIGKGGGKRI